MKKVNLISLIAVLLLLFSEPVNNVLIKKLHLNDKILTEAQQNKVEYERKGE